jgi:hypothetical protein
MLCAVTSKVRQLKYPAQKDEIEELFKECYSLNDKRVQIAHGVWTEGMGNDWTVRHWSRQTLDAKHYLYSVDQLHDLADKNVTEDDQSTQPLGRRFCTPFSLT